MSLFSFILMYAFWLLGCAIFWAVVLFAVGRIFKISSTNLFNVGIASVAGGAAALGAFWVAAFVELSMPGSPVYDSIVVNTPGSWIPLLLQVFLTLVAMVLIVKMVMFAEWDQAALAAVTAIVPCWLIGLGGVWVVFAMTGRPNSVPTQCMAPQLLGSHVLIECGNCKMPYAVAAPNPNATTGKNGGASVSICPNCGRKNPVDADATVLPGDRFLLGSSNAPERWQLVLLQCPDHPEVYHVSRVVGLPNEMIELADGDVFVNGKRTVKEPGVAENAWEVVVDTKFAAAKPDADGFQWKPRTGSGWKFADGEWTCASSHNDDNLILRGRLTDRSGYNLRSESQTDVRSRPIGDVKVDCHLTALSGEGTFGIEWEFRNRNVSAHVSPSGNATITVFDLSDPNEGKRKIASNQGKASESVGRAVLSLAIRDGQAFLLENGNKLASVSLGMADVDSVLKDMENAPADEFCDVSVVSSRCNAKVSQLVVSRDVYYRSPDQLLASYYDQNKKRPPAKVKLDGQSYFVLGDNSTRSRDSRYYGPVKADDVRGVVRMIHWPPSRWRQF